jgi:3-oxoacyl-[acyl-carrier protein] reductase
VATSWSFTGRHVVVTGAAAGIGEGIARLMARSGASLTLWDRDEAALIRVAASLTESPAGRPHVACVDVGEPASIEAAAARLAAPVHVLVNNAGITRDKSLAKMTLEEFDAVVRVNLSGCFYVVKALLPRFEGGDAPKRIVNMASVVALYGNFGQTNYAAAKAGLVGMTKTMARELGKKGFTVNAVAPGFIATAMVAAMPHEQVEAMAKRVPVGRLGKVEDVAAACAFLASDEAGYVNGTVLSVDGGMTI